jgi:hypothetical protein
MTQPRESLTHRLARSVTRMARMRPGLTVTDVQRAGALAGMMALAPLLTILGATLLLARVQTENQALQARLQTLTAPQAARRESAAMLRDAVRQPGLVATLERLARALPDDARLVAVARDAGGQLQVEISASDPDVLRGALRRDPLLAGLRESGQRRTPDARVVVTLRSRP